MNFRRIEHLLEKYFDGNTSLEEEKILKDFFDGDDIPPHLQSLKASFNFFNEEEKVEELGADFDHQILSQIDDLESTEKKKSIKRHLYAASGVAAAILILISIFTNYNPLGSRINETFDNPEIAYVETKKALLFVSGVFNKGIEPVSNFEKFEAGVNNLKKVSSLNQGMNQVEKIGKFYEAQQK